MNHNPQFEQLLKVTSDWYNNDSHKQIIYLMSLGIWCLYILLMLWVLCLNATNPVRSAFYVPLFLFIAILFPLTWWKDNSAMRSFYASHELSLSQSIDSHKIPSSYPLDITQEKDDTSDL